MPAACFSRAAAASLLGALALSLAACSPPETSAARRLNVILIVVDTLRADHLGVYGYGRNTSPNVDALARRSVFFQDARSQAPCTFPSVNSILTSRYPFAFLGQPDQALGIPSSIPTVAEILGAHGYRTAAVSASAIVRNTPSHRNPKGGFGSGFDHFSEECAWKPARCVNRHALGLLAESREEERPLFLYLHYIDPHDPYGPPRDYRRPFSRGRPEKDFVRLGSPNPIADMLYAEGPDPGATPADVQHLRDLYDDEIAYFDSQFGLLVRTLEEGGWLDDTILVFAADHGEEFLEHGHVKHCRTVFDTMIRTPLFFHIPGVPAKTLAAPVQNLDIVPTLLDYLDAPAGEAQLEGRSLRALIETGQAGDSYQYSLAGSYRSASDGRFKLIQHLGRREAWLFDLRRDPGEKINVLAAERRAFHRLRGELGTWVSRIEGRDDEGLRKSEEAEARLRALGYLE